MEKKPALYHSSYVKFVFHWDENQRGTVAFKALKYIVATYIVWHIGKLSWQHSPTLYEQDVSY